LFRLFRRPSTSRSSASRLHLPRLSNMPVPNYRKSFPCGILTFSDRYLQVGLVTSSRIAWAAAQLSRSNSSAVSTDNRFGNWKMLIGITSFQTGTHVLDLRSPRKREIGRQVCLQCFLRSEEAFQRNFCAHDWLKACRQGT
jgi:hypothetical protein